MAERAKKTKRKSPTARTLEYCRARGWTAGVVERWIAQARTRVDLFGCIDVVVVDADGIIGVQATAGTRPSGGGDVAAHLRKLEAEPRARVWLRAGARLEVWGWWQSKRAGRWSLRRVSASLVGDELVWTEGT